LGEKKRVLSSSSLLLTLASLESRACVASSSDRGARCRRELSQASASKGPSPSPPSSWFGGVEEEVEVGVERRAAAAEAWTADGID